MIKQSYDLDLLLQATNVPTVNAKPEEFIEWFARPGNLMFAEGENVGLATAEYPGLYIVHWYFKVRGREAIDLAKRMIRNLFENYGAKTIMGYIRTDLKASRWACRQVGLKSHGIVTFPDGEDNELFILTKSEFLKKEDNNG